MISQEKVVVKEKGCGQGNGGGGGAGGVVSEVNNNLRFLLRSSYHQKALEEIR